MPNPADNNALPPLGALRNEIDCIDEELLPLFVRRMRTSLRVADSKLAEGADDWGAISGSRLGAIEDGYLISEDMLGMPLALTKGSNSFKVPSGKTYVINANVEDLNAMTVTITEKSDGIDEVAAGKTVSDVRFFNVMGQEMSEANGLTIIVTTYTDGSSSAVKVIK